MLRFFFKKLTAQSNWSPFRSKVGSQREINFTLDGLFGSRCKTLNGCWLVVSADFSECEICLIRIIETLIIQCFKQNFANFQPYFAEISCPQYPGTKIDFRPNFNFDCLPKNRFSTKMNCDFLANNPNEKKIPFSIKISDQKIFFNQKEYRFFSKISNQKYINEFSTKISIFFIVAQFNWTFTVYYNMANYFSLTF